MNLIKSIRGRVYTSQEIFKQINPCNFRIIFRCGNSRSSGRSYLQITYEIHVDEVLGRVRLLATKRTINALNLNCPLLICILQLPTLTNAKHEPLTVILIAVFALHATTR